ncbi:MAG: hypothetical protein MZV63_07160 [Marinilabiliales bacterium]|nr:hypothetical protein [Marinilabiliales bacterium]
MRTVIHANPLRNKVTHPSTNGFSLFPIQGRMDAPMAISVRPANIPKNSAAGCQSICKCFHDFLTEIKT